MVDVQWLSGAAGAIGGCALCWVLSKVKLAARAFAWAKKYICIEDRLGRLEKSYSDSQERLRQVELSLAHLEGRIGGSGGSSEARKRLGRKNETLAGRSAKRHLK